MGFTGGGSTGSVESLLLEWNLDSKDCSSAFSVSVVDFPSHDVAMVAGTSLIGQLLSGSLLNTSLYDLATCMSVAACWFLLGSRGGGLVTMSS